MSAEADAGLAAIELSLVAVPRFRRATERFGDRLLRRLFSPGELAYAARKRDGTHNLAARFAAKCAGRRALRRLGARPAGWQQLEVVRRRSGEPGLRIASDGAAGLRVLVSLTHDPDLAAAIVWVERQAKP